MTDIHAEGDRYLAQVIAAAKQRLIRRRSLIIEEGHRLREQLAAIASEEHALNAYEAVKAGKPPPELAPSPRRRRLSQRRKGLKLGLFALIRNRGGLSRAEILKELNLTNRSSGADSVSNALHFLKKQGKLSHDNGVYRIAAAPEDVDDVESRLHEAAD